MDYEVERPGRCCATTGREFVPGESYYSVLMAEGAEVRRHDYSLEAWQGPPPNALGWWKCQIPDRKASRGRWAPNEILLHFFDELAEQPDKQDMRYLLALLLVRRRVMRLEEEKRDEAGQEMLLLHCPRRDTDYEVPAVLPGEAERVDEIQQQLTKLLEG